MRHNSSLVCMVRITYVYIDKVFRFYGYIFIYLFIYFMRHSSSLVCMVRITYVHIDTVFGFYGYIFIYLFIYLFYYNFLIPIFIA